MFKIYINYLFIIVITLLCVPLSVSAGSLDSPAAPDHADSAMYTLESIYNRLDAGTAGSKRGGAFVEPSSGPGATGRTLDEVMGKTPVVDDTDGAAASEVTSGKTFWGLDSGAWGLQTGTLAAKTLSNSSTTVDAGIYTATDLVTVDSDLAAENIKSGVTVFGINGTRGLVAQTGQTPTVPFAAPTGSDGDLQKGIWYTGDRFTDNEDGTVTDNLTTLMWMQNADAGDDCNGADAGTETWANALASVATCNTNVFAGYTDWRLPNMNELVSLIDWRFDVPSLSNSAGTAKWTEGDIFTSVQSDYYFSSTTSSYDTDLVWCMNFGYGRVDDGNKISNPHYVWPVRGGE